LAYLGLIFPSSCHSHRILHQFLLLFSFLLLVLQKQKRIEMRKAEKSRIDQGQADESENLVNLKENKIKQTSKLAHSHHC
jgi:hypothetical protein